MFFEPLDEGLMRDSAKELIVGRSNLVQGSSRHVDGLRNAECVRVAKCNSLNVSTSVLVRITCLFRVSSFATCGR